MNYLNLLNKNDLVTPCFLIDEKTIEGLSRDIKAALRKRWENGIVGYSFKTNNFPGLISFFKKQGFFAEVVSSDEYRLALALGYSHKEIIFNGPVKEKEAFLEAVINGSIVNIDSVRELLWLKELNEDNKTHTAIGLRVNFCLENYCPGESQCGSEDGRFGFSYENGDLKSALDFLKENRIPLRGLHLHCSSKTRSINIYKAIASVAHKIIETYDLNLSYVDIGGGFFGGMPEKPTFDEYFAAVYEILRSHKELNIIIEPGMSVVGAGIDYVTTVIDTKRTLNNQFAVLDGSRTHIDPLKRKSAYTHQIIRRSEETTLSKEERTVLCGFTCMEDDRFFSLENGLIGVGDLVVFHKVGAYTMGLSPQFIEFYPRVYGIHKNQASLWRKKVSAEEFIMINQ